MLIDRKGDFGPVNEAQRSLWKRLAVPVAAAVTCATVGLILAYVGYILGVVSLNVDELFGSGIFWCAIVYLLFAVPFRRAFQAFLEYLFTPPGTLVFILYVAIHLILYGFLFESILASVFGAGTLGVTPGFFVSTNVFLPPSITSAFFDVAFNPSIVATVPPIFSVVLSFYSISVAFVIAVLVLANVSRTKELNRIRSAAGRAKVFVVLPAAGIFFGASCCLSVAGVLSLISPTASAILSASWVFYATYFFLPVVAIVILYLNLLSVGRISTSLRSAARSRFNSPPQTGEGSP
ncbi:MAG TPA: hypothetical protein VEC08_04510 [Nitrososphaerales archaeon]|nr:hypothetical protein [Nitrososphaerales archaeon]